MNENTENLDRMRECYTIARAISAVYTNGNGAEIRTKTKYDLKVMQQTLYVDNVDCNFVAPIKNESNVTGKIKIINHYDQVIVANYT